MDLNWLLLKKSFKTSWQRLALITGSVAIGVAILLSFTAVFNAMIKSDVSRQAWISNALLSYLGSGHKTIAGVDPVYLANSQNDIYGTQNIRVLDMQASKPNSSTTPDVFPGQKAPKSGEYYASPALAELIKDNSDDHLGWRYGKTMIGTIPESALTGRDVLMAIRGSNYQVKGDNILIDGASVPTESASVYSFVPPTEKVAQSTKQKLAQSVVYMGIIILLFPVIMLVSIATRLGSVQREQRYAALRLIGTTSRQVTGIIALESLVSTAIGVVVGIGLYFLFRPALAQFSLSDTRYWQQDIAVSLLQLLIISGLTLVMSLFANWWGMRNVRTSPLGVTRRQKMEKKPGWWRIILLTVGLGLVVKISLSRTSNMSDDQTMGLINQMMLAVVAIMAGLIIATPWVTYRLSQLTAKLSRRATLMVGMKYIQSHARAIARSVSGVVLALFAGSFYILGTSGVAALEAKSIADDGASRLRDGTAFVVGSGDNDLASGIDQIINSTDGRDIIKSSLKTNQAGLWSILQSPCTDMSKYISGLECDKGNIVAIDFNKPVTDSKQIIYGNGEAQVKDNLIKAKAFGDVSESTASGLYDSNIQKSSYLLEIDDNNIDKFRSLLAHQYPELSYPDLAMIKTASQAHSPAISPVIDKLANLAYAGMAVTMVVAIISTVISTVGGLLERRRSMYMLRLGGMQIGELKLMVMFESILPLSVMAIISAGIGSYTGVVFTNIGTDSMKPVVSPAYIAIIAGSILLAAIAIYLVLPTIGKITSPDSNQTE